VQAESLATFLETTADEERKALQLRQIGMCQSHRRRRRAEIQDERARVSGSSRRRIMGVRAPDGTRCQIWRN
jgi:hypothetical protein